MPSKTTLVAGAGGFIGGHLVAKLASEGVDVRAVDIKPLHKWYQRFTKAENACLDLRLKEHCEKATEGVDRVYNFAADMGGMGFIESNKALCMLSVLINTHLLQASAESGVSTYFYASSACVYRADKQCVTELEDGLCECDAYPAMPEDGYGWEKLFSERMCRHFREDFGLQTRVARFHNIYGAHETWRGGREKAPAAICRKVIEAKRDGLDFIEVWGDGLQTRSFTYIDDCIHGVRMLTDSEVTEPLNIGSDQMISIDYLVSVVERIAGVELERRYNLQAPKGVRGRNSNNDLIRSIFGWAPDTRFEDGMVPTYEWIERQVLSMPSEVARA